MDFNRITLAAVAWASWIMKLYFSHARREKLRVGLLILNGCKMKIWSLEWVVFDKIWLDL